MSPDVVFLLQVFVGIPLGNNVRNLIWHGFLSVDEFDPCYNSFLLVLLLSISKLAEPLTYMRNFRSSYDLSVFVNGSDEKSTKILSQTVFRGIKKEILFLLILY